MSKEKIGENAGIIWRTLESAHNKKQTWDELLRITGLNPIELASGIGWLARENKITIDRQGDTDIFGVYCECYY